jgi:hypothetical protein
MDKVEYLKFHRECCDRMVEITAKKNHDYTGDSGDPFFNFTRVEAVGIASTEQGFLTRMWDKFARITTFVNKGVLKVSDESVEDTLLDLANYCILMAGYIRRKKADRRKSESAAKTFVGVAEVLMDAGLPGAIPVPGDVR